VSSGDPWRRAPTRRRPTAASNRTSRPSRATTRITRVVTLVSTAPATVEEMKLRARTTSSRPHADFARHLAATTSAGSRTRVVRIVLNCLVTATS
jgi:hypothetical protein